MSETYTTKKLISPIEKSLLLLKSYFLNLYINYIRKKKKLKFRKENYFDLNFY